MDLHCIQCGFHVKSLYVQYSPGNIRLIKCDNCKSVADEYIECPVMILIIDLILHKEKAYRHLFFNMFTRDTLNSKGLLWRSEEACSSSLRSAALFQSYGKMLVDVVLGNFMFLSVLLVWTRVTLTASVGFKDILLAILVSSYFRTFVIAMMVWEFPPVFSIIDAFVLSSNAVALNAVITGAAMIKCFGACFSAHAAKFLVSWLLTFNLQNVM
ncbi:hypothetical protein RJ640_023980 [Escallonia rubra]|uniref:Protein ARV n=1 Tax=Escallonia rubra TaxID=112253 RepID=A0AA88QLI5_9ASTE|nr:hypothetical protein RJ640_023980 [Escallonia rubra]